MSGVVEALWSKRAHGGPMDSLERATFVAGKGIEGSAGRSNVRQVTIISRDAWAAMMAELSADAPPAARRANVMVSGLSLANSRGRILRLGNVRIRIRGETRPCELMDEAWPGLQKAMDPEWRGGAFGEVVDGGSVALGDPASWEPA